MEPILCRLPFELPKGWRDKLNGQGRCVQGNNTRHTHTGDLAYAFDFKLRPGSKVLAARAGVVVAFSDHFDEGGEHESLLPRANFVALRHADGTYTRYVHLKHEGVLVRVGQEVGAGQPIALSGNTGFTSAPHLHFDAVDMLPEETSELRVLYPSLLNIPSVAAIFSGPLGLGGEVAAPLVYLSPAALRCCSPSSRAALPPSPPPDRGYPVEHRVHPFGLQPSAATAAAASAALLQLLAPHPEVIVLIDRGGAGGNQTFAAAVEMAADAIAAVLIPPAVTGARRGGGMGRRGRRKPPPRSCRCVGVIVANDRPGHEVFPMAPPRRRKKKRWDDERRAPFPVVMVSRESGRQLKDALSISPVADISPASGLKNECAAGYPGWDDLGASLFTAPALGGGDVDGGVVVSLGAAEHCGAAGLVGIGAGSSSTGSDTSGDQVAWSEDSGDVEDDCDVFDESGFDAAFGAGRQPWHGIWSNPAEDWWAFESDARDDFGSEGEMEEWTRERMIYGAQTLPVRFGR